MSNINKIILGTVQFGLNYGVNNKTGKLGEDDIFFILEQAYKTGIETLDTAEAYGNAHEIIGKFHKQSKIRFKIISKFSSGVIDKYPSNLIDRIKHHCSELDVQNLESYMFHSYDEFIDYISKDPFILEKIKNSGLVNKIGVSIYSNNQIEDIFNYKEINLIQLPFNLFDNELLRKDILKIAYQKGIEVHTRSAFLQGLFFKDVNELQGNLVNLKKDLKDLNELVANSLMSKTSFALNYPISKNYIDKVVIGIDNIEQLHNNIEALEGFVSNKTYKLVDIINIKNKELLNPSNWKL